MSRRSGKRAGADEADEADEVDPDATHSGARRAVNLDPDSAHRAEVPARRGNHAAKSRGSGGKAEALVAYLHMRRGTRPHTKAVLEGHVRSFAQREGYEVLQLLTGIEGEGDLLTLRSLVEHIEATGAAKVLVVGPAREALVALHRMVGVQVLTLAHVRSCDGTAHRGGKR